MGAVFISKSLNWPSMIGNAQGPSTIVVELTEDSHNPPRSAVIVGDYKLMVWGKGWKYLLFNLKDDPGEENDLAKKEPEKLEEMKKVYAASFEKLPFIEPYGGMKLRGGNTAKGPMGPPAKPPSDPKAADKP